MKKSFFGSLFSFQPIAVEELRIGFQEAFKRDELPGHPPLLSYDQRTLSFSFECDQREVRAVQLFRELLAEYIAEHHQESDLLENQRLVPLDGTFINDPIASNERFSLDDDEGLLPLSDSEGSDEGNATTRPVGYQAEVWKPTLGTAENLTPDVVKALARRTGCTISVNIHRNEARIHGGKLRDALSRLRAMENILCLLHSSANAHVLVLSTATDDTRIDFTLPSDNALRRIIVDPDVKSVGAWLGNKCIEQLASFTKGAKAEVAFTTPKNLTTPTSCSTSIDPSSIWCDFQFPEVGNIRNRASVGNVSSSGKLEKLDPLPKRRYVTATESQMIEQWAGQVTESTDPSTAIPDGCGKDEKAEKPGRTRVKQETKDDEDEEESDDGSDGSPQVEYGQQSGFSARGNSRKSMNEVLNRQLNTIKSKVGRTRIRKEIDDDESEEEEEDITQRGIPDKVLKDYHEYYNGWSSSPADDRKIPEYHKKASRRRPGRQRVIKADSDDEIEEDVWASRAIKEVQSAQNHLPASWDSKPFQPIHPTASHSFGISRRSSGMDGSVYDGQSGSQIDPCIEPVSATGPALAAKEWSDVAAKAPKSIPQGGIPHTMRDQAHGGDGEGRWNYGGLDGICSQTASTPRAMPGSSHDLQHIATPRRLSSRQRRSSPRRSRSRRGGSGERGCRTPISFALPSVKNPIRKEKLGCKNNPFGLLEVDTLIDTSDTIMMGTGSASSDAAFSTHPETTRRTRQETTSYRDTFDAGSQVDLIDLSTPELSLHDPVSPLPEFGSSGMPRAPSSAERAPPSPTLGLERSSAGEEPNSSPSTTVTSALCLRNGNPGMDLTEISRQRIEQLRRGRASPKPSTEKLQDVDEESTRTYHRTMNQQAGKPQKRKKAIAEVLDNAWGATQSASQPKAGNTKPANPTTRKAQHHEMSAPKRKLLQIKSSMAARDASTTFEEQSALQTDQFIVALLPVFQAARHFPGALKFEIQLGQFLSPNPEGAYQARCVTVNQWHKLYDPVQGRLAAAATFTNVLTRNGADVDHILKLKMRKAENHQIFRQDSPGRVGLRFEFHCRGKSNDDFRLVVDSKGDYQIERPFRTIGKVNLHIPGQIWDSAGLLTGSTRFPEDRALESAANELVKSIYVPGGRKEVEISYRPPASNEFAVKKVVMRRVSYHMCAMPGKSDAHLQITEVQRLFVECRPNGVYLAYASKYEKMVDQMMVHFEVSLVSYDISQALSANAKLSVGDATAAWTAESILQRSRIKNLLELTSMVVSKIDGVGSHNVGSAVVFLGRESVLAVGSTGAPMTNTGAHHDQHPNQIEKGNQNQNQNSNHRSAAKPSPAPATLQKSQSAGGVNVPGVRGGLARPTAQGYFVGYGGARIPPTAHHQVADAATATAAEPVVAPDDSASQAAATDKDAADMASQVMPGFW